MPKEYFTGLEVEEGGTGDGIVFRTGLKVMGKEWHFHMRVTEPGRVMAETNLDTDLVTRFIVEPRGHGQSEVIFNTMFQASLDLKGWLERLTAPVLLWRVYRVELQQLATYARFVLIDDLGTQR